MGLLIITEADRRRLGIAGVQTRFEPEAGRKVLRRRLPFSDEWIALCWRVESFFMYSTFFMQIQNSLLYWHIRRQRKYFDL